MKSRAERPKAIVRLLFYAAMLFLLSWILLWGDNSFLNTWNIGRRVEALEKEMKELKAQNEELKQENERLKTDPMAAEKVAREKFGFTKEGEKVFRFVTPEAQEK
ncbi:MAG: septum formation initiator family protein [Candidatus Cloacimonetes bacterium]|nr:septum formation initiator family protein [Candidatus Cloacimonadota bacterium]